MKKILTILLLTPILAFAAAGDIKIDRKNSTDTAWITTIFAKVNNGVIGLDSSGVPSTISNLTWSSTGMKLASTATSGYEFYNTVDQTTNYERAAASWSANVFNLLTSQNGTGTLRSLNVGVTGVGSILFFNGPSSSGAVRYTAPGTSGAVVGHIFTHQTNTSTSGSIVGVQINSIYNQSSGNAANTDLLVNRTQTAVGSGTQRLLDLQVGGTSRFSVDNTGSLALGTSGAGSIKDSSLSTRFSWGTQSNSYTGNVSTGGNTSHIFNGLTQTGNAVSQVGVGITFTLNQTGAAGFVDLLIDRTETAAGTGAQYWEDRRVGGVSRMATGSSKITTTDATVTTVQTYTIPASTTWAFDGYVVARRTGGSSGTAEDGASYRVEGVIKNVAGTATSIGSTVTVIGESQAGWDVTVDVTGATARVRVTGAANNNVSWVYTGNVRQISS